MVQEKTLLLAQPWQKLSGQMQQVDLLTSKKVIAPYAAAYRTLGTWNKARTRARFRCKRPK